MPNDILGIKMLYPTKSGSTNSWFIKDGFENDPRVRIDEKVTGDNTNGYHLEPNDAVRLSIAADSKDVDIGCKNDFPTSLSRGFVYKSNDWTNIEMTGFFKLTNNTPSDNEIILKGPTGEHHSNTTCCSGSTYQVRVGTENPLNFQHAKEMWHVNYDAIRDPISLSSENYSVLGHGWFGVKFVNYIKVDNNQKIRHVETWYNPDGNGQVWTLALVDEDTGGWGDKGDTCNGDKDQILAWGNARAMYRWDYTKTDIKFRNLSVREIDPFAQFGENPTDPQNPPTNVGDVIRFQATLKLQRHINYDDGIGCGVAGGSSTQKAYEVLSPLSSIEISDHSSFSNRKRGTEQCANSSSKLKCIPLQLDVFIIKVGSPAASPTIGAKIWDSTGAVKYTSPTTIDPTTLPTSFPASPNVTFSFSTNTYTMQVGDYIGIEYLGTSSSNYLKLGRINSSSYDGTNSIWVDYEGTTWDDSPTRDLAGTIWK